MSVEVAPWLRDSRWPTVPIRYVARLGTGHTPSRQHPEYWENCTIPWVTLADVGQLRDGTVDTISSTVEKISLLGIANSSAVRHPPGTVILSRTASVGFSAILGADMATSQDFATWTCGARLDRRYLLHALRAMAPDLRRLAMGSTHKTIYMPDIAELRIPLPSLSDQRRITDFLDNETQRIDRIGSMRSMQIELLKELATALVSDNFAVGPNVPEVRLGYLAKIQTGVTVDGSRARGLSDVTRPYLRVANVQAGYLDLNKVSEITVPRDVAARSVMRPGDVLMTEGGDLDKLGRGTVWDGEIEGCLHQNHVFVVRVDARRLDPRYLALLTRTSIARAHFERTGTKTTNLASTSSSKIRDLRIPLPALVQQRAIVEAATSALAEVEASMKMMARQRAVLAERRQALTAAAVTGRLDVTTGRETHLA
ncbi:restriction endonuclease subunit S [Dactylosporangium sp. NPDC051485]|uniref:restriction endonuclease subunit S n=1 Tax=Dactylosporangium sp. NPDC051485 TaxID=3154846 RepID=UPI00344900FB